MMKFTDVKTKTKKNEFDEYEVTLYLDGEKFSTYYTNDKEDAVGTAVLMTNHGESLFKCKYCGYIGEGKEYKGFTYCGGLDCGAASVSN